MKHVITLVSSALCVLFTSVTATPVLMRDTFEAGDPISKEEFSNAVSSKSAGKLHKNFLYFLGQPLN
jgi:hypothetical protein